MNGQEKARIIAKKVMGYTVYTPQEWETVLDKNDCVPDPVLLITDLGLRDAMYPSAGGGGYYDPANNVTQAIEAAETWRKTNDEIYSWWLLASPNADRPDWECELFHPSLVRYGDTPAAAIVDALVTALEKSEC